MSFTEWYIRKKMNKDLSKAHSSIWNVAKEKFEALSPARKAELKQEYKAELRQEYKDKITGKSEEQNKPKEMSAPSILPEGVKIPDNIRGMNELYDYLNLSKSEREKASDSSTQLSLFPNPKISTLIKALKKVSRA